MPRMVVSNRVVSFEDNSNYWNERFRKGEFGHIRQTIHDYAEATSIHGIRYTMEKERTLGER